MSLLESRFRDEVGKLLVLRMIVRARNGGDILPAASSRRLRPKGEHLAFFERINDQIAARRVSTAGIQGYSCMPPRHGRSRHLHEHETHPLRLTIRNCWLPDSGTAWVFPDRGVEAAMTAIFVFGPLGAVIGFVVVSCAPAMNDQYRSRSEPVARNPTFPMCHRSVPSPYRSGGSGAYHTVAR